MAVADVRIFNMNKYILIKDINSFFEKGDLVEIISDWGDLLYIEKGIFRVAVQRNEIKEIK